MKIHIKIIFCLPLMIILTACNRPDGGTPTPAPVDVVGTMVSATMTTVNQITPVLPTATAGSPTPMATLQPSETPTATQTEIVNNVRGQVCYPSESIPEMTAYFQDIKTDQVVELPISAGHSQYEVNLPPGTYQAYAWLPDFSNGGLYSKAVPCGLTTSCKDHSALTFEIKEGAMVEGVDICDWYGGPFAVPYPPGKKPGEVTGTIRGLINYPGSGSEIRVFFFNTVNQEWGYYNFKEGTSTYTLPNVKPGTYNIVAYNENGQAGGHADAAHNLIPIAVKAGETVDGVDINDWNAPAGTFPPDPTR